MDYFFLLFGLIWLATQIDIAFDNSTLSIAMVHSLPLQVNDSSVDRCKKLVIKPNCLYSLSTEGIFQDWLLSTYATNTLVGSENTTSHSEDMDLGLGEALLYILNSLNGSINIQFLSSGAVIGSKLQDNYFSQTSNKGASQVATKVLSHCYLVREYDTVDYMFVNNGLSVNSYALASVNATFYLSSDRKFMALCQPNSLIFLYNFTSMSLLHTFTPSNAVLASITNRIAFDAASTLMIIETDNFNPVLVVSLSNYSTVHSFSYPHTIRAATFFNSGTDFILLTADDAVHIFDSRTGLLHDASGLVVPSSAFTSDFANTLFVCKQNTVYQYSFSYGILNTTTIVVPVSPLQTNTTYNTTETNVTSQSYQDTIPQKSQSQLTDQKSNSESQVIDESSFYYSLNKNEVEKTATENLGSGIYLTIETTKQLAMFISSSPFLVYFLGYINYLTLCSIYVLLNFPIPRDIYSYIKNIFNFINVDVFSILDVPIHISTYSQEQVNREKPKFFSITSDVVSGYYSLLIIILINYLLIFLFHLVTLNLQKDNVVRKFLQCHKWELLCSQLVNALIPIVLPWSFIHLRTGFVQINSKVNFALYTFYSFAAFAFLFLYLFNHIKMQKNLILKERRKRSGVKQFFVSKTIKITYFLEKRKQKPLVFRNILTVKVIGEWFNCLANFLYPSLVLLENPAYFLIGASIFTVLNPIIFVCDFRHHKNDFFLSLYPLIFHICFIIFFHVGSTVVLIYTEIICLSCLLLGLVHFSLTSVIKIFYFLFRSARNLCQSNKVAPNIPLQSKVAQRLTRMAVSNSRKKKAKSSHHKQAKVQNSEETVETKTKKVQFQSRLILKATRQDKIKIKKQKTVPKNALNVK